MNRSKPLRAKKPWPDPAKRRKRVKGTSDKKAAARPDELIVQEAVFRRDRTCQVAALLPRDLVGDCFGPPTVHHVRKSGAGGSYVEANLKQACASHNSLIEDSPEVAAAAEAVELVIREGHPDWESLGRRAQREAS